MSIPKRIHYVWVGKSPMPSRVKDIIANNKKILGPSWKVSVWTERDFDIQSNPFTKYWYEKKEWAFVSDYLRAHFVYKHGGFYLDTDVLLTKKLNILTKNDYVASRTNVALNTMSIFGAAKKHTILKKYMSVVEKKKIVKKFAKIKSINLHSYILRKFIDIPDVNKTFEKDGISIQTEDVLQIKVNNKNIAIHEHHNNWRGNKTDMHISKQYHDKVNKFISKDNTYILKEVKKRNKKLNFIGIKSI